MNCRVLIRDREVGSGSVFVIAEAGVNHNGDLGRALAMVDVAADSGADAIKFQTFRSEHLVSVQAPKAIYQATETGVGNQLSMLKALELSESDHRALIERSNQRGVIFLSTPFEESSADFLESLDLPAFKIPSGEVTNLPFLRHVASKGRPIILSTGMSNIEEVMEAVDAIKSTGNSKIVLLHCVSQYPADPRESNLRAMATMQTIFQCPVGFSDHSSGSIIAIAAVALGAAVIEKHFTLDRKLPGPDHRASLEPAELGAMIKAIRETVEALGDGKKRPQPSEADTAAVARKSLFVIAPVGAGEPIQRQHLAALRPGTGLSPALLEQVIGRRATHALPADTMLQWSDLV